MGVRLPTAAEIENLRRALEEEERRRLESELTQPHVESVKAEVGVSAVVEEGAEVSTGSFIEDDVVSMPAPLNKADAYNKPDLNGKSKKR